MYDLLVFIGRFQPLHKGHQEVIERARELSKNVLVLVGSAGVARSTRNPFTYEERAAFIRNLYPDVNTAPIADHAYNDTAWVLEVQQTVETVIKCNTDIPKKNARIGLIGCDKDHTSYYLKLFPDWNSEAVQFVSPLNATAFREKMFTEMPERHEWAPILDPTVYDWIAQFRHTPEFAQLKMEYDYLVDYRQKYGEGPFLTADALVQVGGKILLIIRGREYGHGLFALPGGFVGKGETFRNAAIRELREETRLKVPDPVLRGSIKAHQVFDDPHRSERARLVTECFHIHLANDTRLPEVRGSDDAEHADWYDLAFIERNRDRFFEDHYSIIKTMLGLQ